MTRGAKGHSRFAGIVAVIWHSCLARSNGRVIDQLEQMLAVASHSSDLLAMLLERIKLVREGRLQLLTRDIAQLGLSNKRLRLCPDELLLEHDDARRVGLLILQLRDLVGDLRLAVAAGLDGRLDVPDRLDRDPILVVPVDELIFELADLVDQDAELVGDVGDVVVAGFAPEGQLLLDRWSAANCNGIRGFEADILQRPSALCRPVPCCASHSSPS